MKAKGCKMCGKLEAMCKSLRIRGARKSSIAGAGLGLSAGILANFHFGTLPR